MIISTPTGDVELTGAALASFLASLPGTPTPTIDDYRQAIQTCVDAKAAERGYDSGHAMATYSDSEVPAWATEAQAFKSWRDAVWIYAFAELAKVESGEREQPTPEQICSELPALEWS